MNRWGLVASCLEQENKSIVKKQGVSVLEVFKGHLTVNVRYDSCKNTDLVVIPKKITP
jgi:hypothetical protein